jgi:cellulose synthase/poly-beta-1,6-N-acetylglucosamine synthase-like glycosyltransferase
MTRWEIAFWICAALVAYAYFLYPLLLAVLSRLCGRPVRRGPGGPRSVSVVLCAHNEDQVVQRRLRELTGLITESGLDGEVVLVSDGSTDGTAAMARGHTSGVVRVVELPHRVGKAQALSRGAALAAGDVLVFADMRQTWHPDALRLLLENFADPEVGAASGNLVLRDADGLLHGISLYWRMEKALRHNEGRLWSTTGVTGAISAVRRWLFHPVPAGTVLDDVYWPLRVAMRGYRVVHDARAVAYDRLPPTAAGEFRRKLRTLAGNFQLLCRLPAALGPWRNPVAWQFVSHKVLRLVAPWALAVLLAASAALPGTVYRLALAVQLWGYGAALAGLAPAVARRSRLAAAAGSFLVLNAAAWVAFWVWLSGRADHSWGKVAYSLPAPGPALAAGVGEGAVR